MRGTRRVLRLLMIDALHAVRVATVEEEALRDLVPAREDLRGDLMRARQRLACCCCVTGSCTRTPRARGRSVIGRGCARRISAVARRATLLDYLGGVDTLELRRGQVEATIAELVPSSP